VAKASDLIDARLTRLEAAFERFEEMLGECEEARMLARERVRVGGGISPS
jgi:hypothetical protein